MPADWMLDITTWPSDVDSFVDAMVWLVGRMLAHPSTSRAATRTAEPDRIMTARPRSSTGVRALVMNLYRRCFDLVAAGRTTIEVRVQHPNLRSFSACPQRGSARSILNRWTVNRDFRESLPLS